MPLPVRVPRLVLAGVAKQAKKRHRSMYLSLLKTQSNRQIGHRCRGRRPILAQILLMLMQLCNNSSKRQQWVLQLLLTWKMLLGKINSNNNWKMTTKILIIKKESRMGKLLKIRKETTRQMANFNDLQLTVTVRWLSFSKTRFRYFTTSWYR